LNPARSRTRHLRLLELELPQWKLPPASSASPTSGIAQFRNSSPSRRARRDGRSQPTRACRWDPERNSSKRGVTVSPRVKPAKVCAADSSHTGLRHLLQQFRLIGRSRIARSSSDDYSSDPLCRSCDTLSRRSLIRGRRCSASYSDCPFDHLCNLRQSRFREDTCRAPCAVRCLLHRCRSDAARCDIRSRSDTLGRGRRSTQSLIIWSGSRLIDVSLRTARRICAGQN